VVAPFIILLGFVLLLWIPQTSDFTDLMTHRKYPVEWLMFAVHFCAGIYGLRLAFLAKKHGEAPFVYLFYFFFSLALLFIAGEINAWGQKFFEYKTPEWFARHNALNAVTLHNLEGFDNRNHRLRLIYALGGFVGMALSRTRRWNRIGAPAILGWWFGLIAVKSLVDFWVKDFPITSTYGWLYFNWVINRASKITKVIVGISAWLYLWLNKRRLERDWHAATPPPS